MAIVDTIFHNQVYVQKAANGGDYFFLTFAILC